VYKDCFVCAYVMCVVYEICGGYVLQYYGGGCFVVYIVGKYYDVFGRYGADVDVGVGWHVCIGDAVFG